MKFAVQISGFKVRFGWDFVADVPHWPISYLPTAIVFGRYPSDWAVMGYDAVQVLRQGVEKSRGLATKLVRRALTGMTVRTSRGSLYFRAIDNQLNCPVYFGRLADDPRHPFPIHKELLVIQTPDKWRPEAEIRTTRNRL